MMNYDRFGMDGNDHDLTLEFGILRGTRFGTGPGSGVAIQRQPVAYVGSICFPGSNEL